MKCDLSVLRSIKSPLSGAATKHSPCNQDLGDGLASLMTSLAKAPGEQQSAYLLPVIHSSVTEEAASSLQQEDDRQVLLVSNNVIKDPYCCGSTRVKHYSKKNK